MEHSKEDVRDKADRLSQAIRISFQARMGRKNGNTLLTLAYSTDP